MYLQYMVKMEPETADAAQFDMWRYFCFVFLNNPLSSVKVLANLLLGAFHSSAGSS